MPEPTARLSGYTELLVALRALPRAQQAALRAEFRAVGKLVADAARAKFTGGVARSASVQRTADGFTPVVRLRGVEVDQKLRKTTGLRPDWGKTQMRKGLVPGLEESTDAIVAGIDGAMDAAAEAVGLGGT